MEETKLTSLRHFDKKDFYNKVLYETENFKVIPSLGSLIEGWLLLIPKRHYLSIGQLEKLHLYRELEALLGTVGNHMSQRYGDYISFEHGPVQPESRVGCGVDYAHLHIVPISLNLMVKSNDFSDIEMNWNKVEGIKSTNHFYELRLPYLYFKDINGNSFIGTSNFIPSQFFRQIIASEVGLKDSFDWKRHPFYENIQRTIFTFTHTFI